MVTNRREKSPEKNDSVKEDDHISEKEKDND